MAKQTCALYMPQNRQTNTCKLAHGNAFCKLNNKVIQDIPAVQNNTISSGSLISPSISSFCRVWSYGVLLYEILTVGGSPYPGIKALLISSKLQEGYRMPKPKHVDEKLYQIMLKCWDENPSNRPTFAKLKDAMKDMERNHRTYVNLRQYDERLYVNMEDLTAD